MVNISAFSRFALRCFHELLWIYLFIHMVHAYVYLLKKSYEQMISKVCAFQILLDIANLLSKEFGTKISLILGTHNIWLHQPLPALAAVSDISSSHPCVFWFSLSLCANSCHYSFFYIYWFLERERETSICCSTYLRIHWMILVCVLTGDQVCGPGVLG